MNYLTWKCCPSCPAALHICPTAAREERGSGRGALQRLFTEGFNKLRSMQQLLQVLYSNLETSTQPQTKGDKEYIAFGISSPD